MTAALRTWQLACSYAAIIAGVIVAAGTTKNLDFLGRVCDFPNGDEAGHFLLFGTLGLLVSLSVFEARPDWGTPRIAVI